MSEDINSGLIQDVQDLDPAVLSASAGDTGSTPGGKPRDSDGTDGGGDSDGTDGTGDSDGTDKKGDSDGTDGGDSDGTDGGDSDGTDGGDSDGVDNA